MLLLCTWGGVWEGLNQPPRGEGRPQSRARRETESSSPAYTFEELDPPNALNEFEGRSCPESLEQSMAR